MEKYIVDERNGLKYELVGDYYLIAGDEAPSPEPLGIWGQRHRQFLREHMRCIYNGMLMTGKLENYGKNTFDGQYCFANLSLTLFVYRDIMTAVHRRVSYSGEIASWIR